MRNRENKYDKANSSTPTRTATNRRPVRTVHLADVDHALAASSCASPTETDCSETPSDVFLLDTGCSNHTCGDASLFSDIFPWTSFIQTASGEKVSVEGIGSIACETNLNGRQCVSSLSGVYYIPGLSNLISVGQLRKRGTTMQFTDTGCRLVTQDGVCIANGVDFQKNLFRLDAEVVKQVSIDTTYAAMGHDSAKLWHRRFGHPSTSYLKSLAEQRIIPQLTPQDIDGAFTSPCITCTKGKMSQTPFRNSETTTTSILELVHSDVAGPLPVRTNSGCKYWVTFTDDFSHYVWTFPAKKKSEIPHIFCDWLSYVENQNGRKLKTLRTDNGSEYSLLDELCAEKGIKRETTIPYTPQQNGLAERMNRTISVKINCMLIDSGLSPKWWAEALITATYLINRLPTRPLGMKSPYQLYNGRRPNISQMRVFGTECEALVLPKPGKLSPKTRSCIFLGFTDLKKGYRLWDKERQKIIFSRDVTFIEGEDRAIDLEIEPFDENHDPPTDVELEGLEQREHPQREPDTFGDNSDADRQDEITQDGFDEPNNAEVEDPQPIADEPEAGIDEAPIVQNGPALAPPPLRPGETRLRSGRVSRPVRDWWVANQGNALTEVDRGMLGDYLVANAAVDTRLPSSYDEAVNGPDSDKWKEAMEEELASFHERGVMRLEYLPKGRKPVGCKWVYAFKFDTDGNVIRYKARLVAQGFSQIKGIDFDKTYSPVASMVVARVFLSYVNHHSLYTLQADVKTAYLYGDMEEVIYMKPPQGMIVPNGNYCRILKSLYGLKQSSRSWYKKLDDKLRKIGFEPIETKPCFYARADGAILVVYVDDIAIAAKTRSSLMTIYKDLERDFKLENCGDFGNTMYLGLHIRRNRDAGTIMITQEQYIDKAAQQFGVNTVKKVKSAMLTDCYLAPLQDDENRTSKPYLEIVGTLMYLATGSRPDISYSVGVLARHNAAPGIRHWNAAIRLLQYASSTRDIGLVMTKSQGTVVEAYSDADWAGDKDTRRSTTGSVVKLFGNLVLWHSRRQKSIAKSSFDAEYIAASATCQQVLWILSLMDGLQIKHGAVPLWIDNQSTLSAIINDRVTERTKHVDIALKLVREMDENGIVHCDWIATEQQQADILTKALTKDRTAYLMDALGIKKIEDDQGIGEKKEIGVTSDGAEREC